MVAPLEIVQLHGLFRHSWHIYLTRGPFCRQAKAPGKLVNEEDPIHKKHLKWGRDKIAKRSPMIFISEIMDQRLPVSGPGGLHFYSDFYFPM
jgi:hypothetical protein